MPVRTLMSEAAATLKSRSIRNGECLEWQGYKNRGGYGQIGVFGKVHYTHRIAYLFYCGAIPDGMFVCHHCDNPSCIEPNHLFLGTVLENNRDAAAKKRLRPQFGGRAISETQALEILAINPCGYQTREIAKRYGISAQAVRELLKGITWAHLERKSDASVMSSNQRLQIGRNAAKARWAGHDTSDKLVRRRAAARARRLLAKDAALPALQEALQAPLASGPHQPQKTL